MLPYALHVGRAPASGAEVSDWRHSAKVDRWGDSPSVHFSRSAERRHCEPIRSVLFGSQVATAQSGPMGSLPIGPLFQVGRATALGAEVSEKGPGAHNRRVPRLSVLGPMGSLPFGPLFQVGRATALGAEVSDGRRSAKWTDGESPLRSTFQVGRATALGAKVSEKGPGAHNRRVPRLSVLRTRG